MAAPVANFNFLANGLEVAFEDLSTNTPTSWAWNFGDSSPTGITQNPVHAYGAAGKYTVTLIATNVTGSSTFGYSFLVSTDLIINQTIEQMVLAELPIEGMSAINLSQIIRKWQLYLQPKVYIPNTVAEADTFKQEKWPSLANVLISKLVVYDQAVIAATRGLIGSMGSASGASGEAGAMGAVKRIEMGPSVAEWHDPSKAWEVAFKTGTSGVSGFIGMLAGDICLFAKRQNIMIPDICPKKNMTTLFRIGKKC